MWFSATVIVGLLALALPLSSAKKGQMMCYSCTSYMEQCKDAVDKDDSKIFKMRCSSMCYLRTGEDGSLYRGCFDGFKENSPLQYSYMGCRNQTWNNKVLSWCLCDTDKCNGMSIDALSTYYKEGGSAKQDYSDNYEDVYPDSYNDNEVDEDYYSKQNVDKYEYAYEGEGEGEDENKDTSSSSSSSTSSASSSGMDSFAREGPVDPNHREDYLGVYSYDDNAGDDQNKYKEIKYISNDDEDDDDDTYYSKYQGNPTTNDHGYYYNNVYQQPHDSQAHTAGFSGKFAGYLSNTVEDSASPAKEKDSYLASSYPQNAYNTYYGNKRLYGNQEAQDAYTPYRRNGGAKQGGYGAVEDLFSYGGIGQVAQKTTDNMKDKPHYVSAKLAAMIHCSETGYYQNPNDCRQFVACVLDPYSKTPIMHVMKCPEGLVWDNTKKICMEFSTTCNVAGSSVPSGEATKGRTDEQDQGYDSNNAASEEDNTVYNDGYLSSNGYLSNIDTKNDEGYYQNEARYNEQQQPRYDSSDYDYGADRRRDIYGRDYYQ